MLQVLDGRYHLLQRIGETDATILWRARDLRLGRQVAVRAPMAGRAGDASVRQRLHAEARSAAAVVHPHVVEVYDYVEASGPGGNLPFIVFEPLDGRSLADHLRSGPLPASAALGVCTEVAAAVAAAHACDVVHGDLHPGNVILTSAGSKVVGFGCAPEQSSDGQITPASDVHALGVLLSFVLGERLPPRLPEPVLELYQRCLAADPLDRPSAQQAAEILSGASGRPLKVHMEVPVGHVEQHRDLPTQPLPLRARAAEVDGTGPELE